MNLGQRPKASAYPASRRPKAPPGTTKVRYKILALAFLGIAMNYLDRANLSVALPFMQESLGLELTNTEKGLILGAFFWAYDGAMLAAGWVTDRFGARKSFMVAAIWWSIFTMATSLARGFWSLFVVRLLLGAGEAPAYPSATKAMSRWFPTHERAFATAVVDSGSRVGTVLSLPIITALIAAVSWHFSFIVLGILGIVWAGAWYMYYRDPANHKAASEQEVEYLREYGARLDDDADLSAGEKIRWVDLFRYRTVLGMMLGFFCLNFVNYFFLTWFPTYLLEARSLDLLKLGTLGAIPGLTAVVGAWVVGLTADRMISRGANVTRVRKTTIVGGLLGGSVILFAGMAPGVGMSLVFLSIAYASLAIAGTGIWAYPSDIAPTARHVASIGGIQNFASNIAGIISPFVFGALLDVYDGNYTAGFAVASVVAVLGAATYAFIVGPAERLPLLRGADVKRL